MNNLNLTLKKNIHINFQPLCNQGSNYYKQNKIQNNNNNKI